MRVRLLLPSPNSEYRLPAADSHGAESVCNQFAELQYASLRKKQLTPRDLYRFRVFALLKLV